MARCWLYYYKITDKHFCVLPSKSATSAELCIKILTNTDPRMISSIILLACESFLQSIWDVAHLDFTHFSHVYIYIKKSFYCHLYGKCMNIFFFIYPCKKQKLYMIKSCSNERNLCSIWTAYHTLFYHCNTDIVNILYVELFFSFFSPWNYRFNYKILKFWFRKVWVFMKP